MKQKESLPLLVMKLVMKLVMSLATYVAAVLLLVGCEGTQRDVLASQQLDYPQTKTGQQVDVYHGQAVADPFRWLEGDIRKQRDVEHWVDAQDQLSRRYLDKLPARPYFANKLRQLWDYERFGVPVVAGGKRFYTYNNGLQNQAQVMMQATLDAEPEVVVDPNTWSSDGTVALAGFVPDPSGRYLALMVSSSGSDWRELQVLDLQTQQLLPERLRWLKFTTPSWAQDSSGLFYSRYPQPNQDVAFQALASEQALYFHPLGTPQEQDSLVFKQDEKPLWRYSGRVTDDGQYLVITIGLGTDSRYQIAYLPLPRGEGRGLPQPEVKMLVAGFNNDYSFVDHIDGEFYFRTDLNADLGRLVALRLSDGRVREVIAERDATLLGVSRVGDLLFANYLRDARSEVLAFDLGLQQPAQLRQEVQLPQIGSASGFAGDADSTATYFHFSSITRAPGIYRLPLDSLEAEPYQLAQTNFDAKDFRVEQRFYRSKDGTEIPMFIAHKVGLQKNGAQPTLLYGYGGFNVSLTPRYSTARMAWLEAGGVYVTANLRGGGEYGRAWHQAGTKLNKQNVFDDFIAAAESLISLGYTAPEHLGIMGGSNGGLLVGAVLNQRPELFGAAIPQVGVMDMLRFHQFTAGRFWIDDYGSADNPQEFEALYAYSPYHNLSAQQQYPATLVTSADTDDRVVPGHSFKYAARLQQTLMQRQRLGEPVAPGLLRVERKAGHGAGTPTAKLVDGYADNWAFLWSHLASQPLPVQ